jgi:hypothetical protein
MDAPNPDASQASDVSQTLEPTPRTHDRFSSVPAPLVAGAEENRRRLTAKTELRHVKREEREAASYAVA